MRPIPAAARRVKAAGRRALVFRSDVPIRSLLQPGDTRIVVEWEPAPLRGYIPSFIPAPELLAGNARFAFQQAGGEIELEGVSIEGRAEWETDFKVGESYLLFIHGDDRPGAWVNWSYRITPKQTLESLFIGFLEEDEADTGHGLPVSRARLYLKQAR